MATHRVNKASGETFPITFDYTGELPDSVTVSSATGAAVKKSDGSTDNTVLNSTTLTTTNTTVKMYVTGGTDGESYLITATVTCSGSPATVLEEYVVLNITDQPF